MTARQREDSVRPKQLKGEENARVCETATEVGSTKTRCQFQLSRHAPTKVREMAAKKPGSLAKADIRRGGICAVDCSCGKL